MTYSYGFKAKFAIEFSRLSVADQDKILDFAQLFELHGLSDLTKYVGKVRPSWSGNASQAAYVYAQQNDLWHYHVGIPTFTASTHGQFLTSEYVLHFQWKNRGRHIDLVDLYSHYRHTGSFYLPGPDYLAD